MNDNKTVTAIEFEVTPKKMGNSCYILLPKDMLGKTVKIKAEILK